MKNVFKSIIKMPNAPAPDPHRQPFTPSLKIFSSRFVLEKKKTIEYEAAQLIKYGGTERQYRKEKIAGTLKALAYSVQKEYPIGRRSR